MGRVANLMVRSGSLGRDQQYEPVHGGRLRYWPNPPEDPPEVMVNGWSDFAMEDEGGQRMSRWQ